MRLSTMNIINTETQWIIILCSVVVHVPLLAKCSYMCILSKAMYFLVYNVMYIVLLLDSWVWCMDHCHWKHSKPSQLDYYPYQLPIPSLLLHMRSYIGRETDTHTETCSNHLLRHFQMSYIPPNYILFLPIPLHHCSLLPSFLYCHFQPLSYHSQLNH